MKTIKKWFDRWRFKHGYYKIEELMIGGNCGLCGEWIPDEIFPVSWSWGICKKHI